MTLRISNPSDEGVYQASKWLKFHVLVDEAELASLFELLGDFWIFPITGVRDGKPISSPLFLSEYGKWIEGLKNGKVPSPEEYKRILACVFTEDLDSLWLQPVGEGRFLTKMRKPVVQVQAHFFSYSAVDEVFRPMSMGRESVFWGLQFSFPQFYQDPKTMDICETTDRGLFRKIQLWVRNATLPTPFVVNGKKTNSPIRLGKQCFSWIHRHPQLQEQQIHVAKYI